MIEPSLLLAAALLAQLPDPPVDEALDRVLARAVGRLQSDLVGRTVLYADHSTWETAWRVRSEHYEVRTVLSRRQGEELAQNLDAMLANFGDLLGTSSVPREPFQVWVFPTVAEYNAHGNNSSAAEHSSFYGTFFSNADSETPVVSAPEPNGTLLNMQLTHSAFHQWLAASFQGQTPYWIEEGLASYFEMLWAYPWGVSELRRMRGNGRNLSLAQLMGSNEAQFFDGQTRGRIIQTGLFFRYLLFHREDTRREVVDGVVVREPFAEYLRLVVRGQNVSGHPVQTLLTRDRGQLERDFHAFDGW